MFLGLWTLGTTLQAHIQLKNGNAPVTADSGTITARIYKGSSESLVLAATVSSAVTDSLTGWHLLSAALTIGNGFASETVYTIRLTYTVSGVTKVQDFTFQVA